VGVLNAKPGGTAGAIALVPARIIARTGAFLYAQTVVKGESVMKEQKIPYKIYLTEEEIPRVWYNIRTD